MPSSPWVNGVCTYTKYKSCDNASVIITKYAISSSRIARGVIGNVSSVNAVMSGRPSGQSRWLHQQHQHHQHEDHGVGSLGIKILRQSLDHAERKAGDDRPHDRTHAAD